MWPYRNGQKKIDKANEKEEERNAHKWKDKQLTPIKQKNENESRQVVSRATKPNTFSKLKMLQKNIFHNKIVNKIRANFRFRRIQIQQVSVFERIVDNIYCKIVVSEPQKKKKRTNSHNQIAGMKNGQTNENTLLTPSLFGADANWRDATANLYTHTCHVLHRPLIIHRFCNVCMNAVVRGYYSSVEIVTAFPTSNVLVLQCTSSERARLYVYWRSLCWSFSYSLDYNKMKPVCFLFTSLSMLLLSSSSQSSLLCKRQHSNSTTKVC